MVSRARVVAPMLLGVAIGCAPRAVETAPPPAVEALEAHVEPVFEISPERLPDPAAHRPRRLLMFELQSLEALASTSPRSSSDRPKILRRLGHTYADLALRAAKEEPDQHKRTKITRSAARQAVKHLDEAVSLDRSLEADPLIEYTAGLLHEACGEDELAIARYQVVVTRSPPSDFVPLAYFGLGVVHERRGEMDLARAAYSRCVETPHARNPVVGEASRRAGWPAGVIVEPLPARVPADP